MAFPFVDRLLKRIRSKPFGVSGAVAYIGGYDTDVEERDPRLSGERKYETYINILTNVSVVAASVRYFLNLAAKSEWSFTPAETDPDGVYAKIATDMLLKDPLTSWHRIIRRMALYRFYGFSLQEFTVRRRDDGVITIDDINNRPQTTIKEWIYDTSRQNVISVRQQSPIAGDDFVIPRNKLMYIVDDTISDSPAGLGLLRHIVPATEALKRYEQLEGIGFETDLRGIPIGRAPLTRLQQMVKSGEITDAQRKLIEGPLREFLQNRVRTPNLGLLLDSHPYHSMDEANRPSTQKQWDLSLLQTTSSSLEAIARAIQRLNREIARVLGTEQLMLGEDIAGSFALSSDKTQSFTLLVEGALKEMKEVVRRDVLSMLWALNGFPIETMPTPKTETVTFRDIKELAEAFKNIADAGAKLCPDDPAVQEFRDILGMSRTPQEIIDRLLEQIANENQNSQNPQNSGGSANTA